MKSDLDVMFQKYILQEVTTEEMLKTYSKQTIRNTLTRHGFLNWKGYFIADTLRNFNEDDGKEYLLNLLKEGYSPSYIFQKYGIPRIVTQRLKDEANKRN